MSSNDMRGDLILKDISNGQTFLLRSNVRTYVCGRAKNVDIQTPSIMASREHCHFTRIRGELNVADVGSSNGIFINGVHKPPHTMVLLKINDLIGIGCPEVTPSPTPTPRPAAHDADRPIRPQIKTIYRLEFPSTEPMEEDDVPVDKKQQPMEICAKELGDKRRLSKDSFDHKLPCKKFKTDEMIPDVIDLADDSNDGIPIPNNDWNRLSTSSNVFSAMNLSAIKVEAFGEISTSRERELSSRLVNGHDTSPATSKSTSDSRNEKKKSLYDDHNQRRDKTKDTIADEERSSGAIKKPKYSRDTDSTGDLDKEKTKSAPIPTSPPSNRVQHSNFAASSIESSRRKENVTGSRQEDRLKDKTKSAPTPISPPSNRVEHSNFAASSIESSRRKENVTGSRQEDRLNKKTKSAPTPISPPSNRVEHPNFAASSIESSRRNENVTNSRGEDSREEKKKSNDNQNSIGLLSASAKHSIFLASSIDSSRCKEQVVPIRRASRESSSEEEIDILKREDFVDPDDETSHSSWENVEDFSIPGYNADESESPKEKNIVVPLSSDAVVDQQVKYEPELHIIDNDESIYMDVNHSSQSFTPTPLKLKRVVKQEPITEYSQFDYVELSDDENDVFAASQLFGDDEGLETETKIKNENNLSDEEAEREIYDRRDSDSPLLIQLSDSEEEVENNPWYDRLMRAELNASRESVIQIRDRAKLEEAALKDSNKENIPLLPPEADAPMSPAEQDVPMLSPEHDDPMSPPEQNGPMSPADQDVPMSSPEHDDPMSPPEQDDPMSPPKAALAKADRPESPILDVASEIFELCFASDEDKTDKAIVDTKKHKDKKQRAKSHEKTPKPTEEHAIKKVVQEKEKSRKDDSSSLKKRSSDDKKHKKHSHHHTKQKSEDRLADSEDSEAKDTKKSNSHKRDGEKRRHSSEAKAASVADSSYKKRDSTEEKSNLRTKATHLVDSNKKRDSTEEKSSNRTKSIHVADSSRKKRDFTEEESYLRTKSACTADGRSKKQVSPEQKSNLRTETTSIDDSNKMKRQSPARKSNQRAETPSRSMADGIPVVLLTKVDHVRKSVPIVEAPIIGNNQRRGVSCNVQVIDRSTGTPDNQRASTSGTQVHETNGNKASPPKERRLSAKEKKDLKFKMKILENQRKRDDKYRKMNNRWAIDTYPRTKIIPPQMSREEKGKIKISRAERLKLIADKQKEAAEANAVPVKRVAVKAKAKVTQRTRNDFLVDEIKDQYIKESTNAERTSVDNRNNKISDAKKIKETAASVSGVTSISDVTKQRDEAKDETTNLRNQTVTYDEIPPINGSTFYGYNSEQESEVSSSQLERELTTNGEASPVNDEHSPKGKKRRDKDCAKESTTNNEIPLYSGFNFYKENNEQESEVSSSHVEKEKKSKSPKKTKKKCNSPDATKKNTENGVEGLGANANFLKNVSRNVESGLLFDPRREVAISNGYVEKSSIQTSVPRAAMTQNDRQWYDKTNGTRVLEESNLGCRRTLNNNVIYEKESTITSRDPRLKTGKPVKLKSLLKKQRRSIASKPRVIKRVTFDELNTKVQLFEIDPGNSLRKCDFKGKDSLLAMKQNSSTTCKALVAVDCPKLEEFLVKIFAWNPVWLEQQKNMPGPPPVVDEKSLVRMISRYETYKAYYKVAEPLMALELWYSITNDYNDREKERERTGKNNCMFSVVENSVIRSTVPSTDVNVTTLKIEIVVSKKGIQDRTHPDFGDLIFFEYESNIRAKQGVIRMWKVFAYVTKIHQCLLTPTTLYNRDLAKFVSDPYMLLTLTVMTKPLNPMEMQTNKINRLGKISYLRSWIRTIQALQSLPTSTLSTMILNPKIEDYQLPCAGNLESYPLVTKDNLNPKQLEAVARVTEAVTQKLPKICLIQGPPGTGKSKVIVNMMMQILYGRVKNPNKKGTRILVCAPSNAAIDEIVLRLLEIRRTFEKGKRFNMVRIGRDYAMHPMVKEVSLTELAKKNVKATADTYKSPEFTPECVQEEKNRLEARKNSLELELATSRTLDPARLKQLRNKLSDIEASYGLLISGRSAEHLDKREAFKLQRGAENALLKGADVIACTLSSCYTDMMQSVFGETDAMISVCIVDEATQSIEAETLVPLMLGVQTLVLVGDTNQLPATVLSQKAKGLGLDQSLFARIQRSFDGQENNPIILLDTQYRMSHHVAYWPNRYFYSGALKNSESLRNLPTHFYKVINLDSTQDIDVFTNTNEAYFVANLVYSIMSRSTWDNSSQQVRIGIITPYSKQKVLVTSKIRERIAMLSEKTKKRFVYEVNTVDSFQGQERDIIIMSCVRSSGIGFLADPQRLCVALTRARHSLIVCGNFATFKKNPMWNALLTDARSRGVYLNMRSSAEVEEIMKNVFR